MTPAELALELDVSPKRLRGWLRANFPRAPYETSQRWDLDQATVDAARTHFSSARTLTVAANATRRLASEDDDDDSLEVRLDEFRRASLHTRGEVLGSPCPVPRSPGIYGWWFRTLPAQMNVEQCLVRDGLTLLYTGISPQRPPSNGRPASSRTLRDRITYHYSGNAEGSTLRKTLGILLAATLGIELRRVGSGKRMTFGADEQRLSAWMAENARVCWLVDPKPWVLEERFIAHLDVPLNLQGNLRNAFHPELTASRAAAVARARELDAIENPGIGGR